MLKRFLYVLFLLGGIIFFPGCIRCEHHSRSNNNQELEQKSSAIKSIIPNEQTAKKVVKAILSPIYGDNAVDKMNFHIKLIKDSIWVVSESQKELSLGGTFYIEIRKSDCKVLKLTLGK